LKAAGKKAIKVFYNKLFTHCKKRNTYSIKQFVEESPIKAGINHIIEQGQEMCLRNTVIAWVKERIIDKDQAIVYLRENGEDFRDFEQYYLRTREIKTQEQKDDLLEQYTSNHILFNGLVEVCESDKKVSSVRLVLKKFGEDYDEVINKARMTKEWWSLLDTAHECCAHNLEHRSLLFHGFKGCKKYEKLWDEALNEYEKWTYCIKKTFDKPEEKEKPALPLIIEMVKYNERY